MKIAILISVFNRIELTRNCIASLYEQQTSAGLDIYIYDSGSTDGTTKILSQEYPKVTIVTGRNTDFWASSMRKLWVSILENGVQYDYFLLMNNDLVLYPNAIRTLLESTTNNSVISGLLIDEDNQPLYCGFDKKNNVISSPNTPIHSLNGNLCLVPYSVYENIGVFDKRYSHHLADVDFGFMCKRKGIRVVSSSQICGITERNDINRLNPKGKSIRARFSHYRNPLNVSVKEQVYFFYKHKMYFRMISFPLYILFKIVIPKTDYD